MNKKDSEFFIPLEELREKIYADPKEIRHDLKTLYEQACRELTLQQDKRDKTISIYVAVIAFLVPFVFSKEATFPEESFMGWLLLIAGIVGVFFSLAVIRYRIYKECYWITCRTISQLQNIKTDGKYTKNVIQALFYHCMRYKWEGYVRQGDKPRILYAKLVANTVFSAEFMMFTSIVLVASALTSFGISIVWNRFADGIYILLGCLAFIGLCWLYFRSLGSVFRVLADGKKSSFDKAFKKAWFLHIYPMESEGSSPVVQE